MTPVGADDRIHIMPMLHVSLKSGLTSLSMMRARRISHMVCTIGGYCGMYASANILPGGTGSRNAYRGPRRIGMSGHGPRRTDRRLSVVSTACAHCLPRQCTTSLVAHCLPRWCTTSLGAQCLRAGSMFPVEL